MRMRSFTLALLVLGLTLPSARAAEKVTLDSLLKQMTDLSLLAEYPDPPYVTKQFSSYDRASEAPGKESWFANADRGFMFYDGVVKEKTPYFQTIPVRETGPKAPSPPARRSASRRRTSPSAITSGPTPPAPDGGAIDGKIPQGLHRKGAVTLDPQGHVLAEMDGPGSVVRIWSADPADAGNIRIYLDDAKEPVIEAPLAELLGGKWKTKIDGKETTPFPDPIACERSRGFNLYFPIAYAKHCKITVGQIESLLSRGLPHLSEGDGGGDVQPAGSCRHANGVRRGESLLEFERRHARRATGNVRAPRSVHVAPGSRQELIRLKERRAPAD